MHDPPLETNSEDCEFVLVADTADDVSPLVEFRLVGLRSTNRKGNLVTFGCND